MNIKQFVEKIKNHKKNEQTVQVQKTYNPYLDVISPYQLVFNPSFLELNDDKLIDYKVLNDMSGEKHLNYLKPFFNFHLNNTLSLYFSPVDLAELLKQYKKEYQNIKYKAEKDINEGKEIDKKMKKMIEDYEEMILALEDGKDSFLNYSILYSQEIDKTKEDYLEDFKEKRIELNRFLSKMESPSKFYTPVGQIEEAYLSQQPLCEYRLKDWSNISAMSGMSLFPFFTETKNPSFRDGVPYGINRNTGEMMFFNHSQLYEDGIITNKNMNVFGGTGAGKTSYFRSQMALRNVLGDHFIIFDPKKDYVSFTKDMGGQNISFKIDEPLGYNFFSRPKGTHKISTRKEDGTLAEIEREKQTLEEKIGNLMKIFSIMIPFLANDGEEEVADFSRAILDSALSNAYKDDPYGDDLTLQKFYDVYLQDSIDYYIKNESDKINAFSMAGERLKANLSSFVVKKDGTKGRYYKMFSEVPKEKQLKLGDSPIINFDLSTILKDDLLFTIATLIGMEFARNQVTGKNWKGKSIYIVIDENWKLLQYERAGEYEEEFSRLIRGLGGGLITMSQHLDEYVNTKYGSKVLSQAQTNVFFKMEPNEFEHLKKRFPRWFTEDVIEDFDDINKRKDSYGIGYLYFKGRMQPFKYLYLPSRGGRSSWQEKESWRLNIDSIDGYEN